VDQRIVDTSAGRLAVTVNPGAVWRVGYRPQPWAWTPWQCAGDTGRFDGRWDDPAGSFRTLYAGRNLLACLLEVLARFRPDPLLGEDLAGIVVDRDDAQVYPTQPPGTVPTSWLTPRQASTATLSGIFCAVTDKESLPMLRNAFLSTALRYGLADLDAGALRLSAPRALTQRIAAWLYDLHDGASDLIDGVQFESRHGDALTLWAIFEQGPDPDVSLQLSGTRAVPLPPDHHDLAEAFRLHRLAWA